MTYKEVISLSPDAKVLKIAEACGWTSIHPCSCKVLYRGICPKTGKDVHLPNFFRSLDDMHAVEKTFYCLDRDKWFRYIEHLQYECAEGEPCGGDNPIHASAEQRANAFLITHYATDV